MDGVELDLRGPVQKTKSIQRCQPRAATTAGTSSGRWMAVCAPDDDPSSNIEADDPTLLYEVFRT